MANDLDASSTPSPPGASSAERTPPIGAGSEVPAQPNDPASDCTGEPPVMTVHDDLTDLDLAPDWSCYDMLDAGAGPTTDAGPPSAPDASTRSVTFRLSTLLPAVWEGVTADFYFGPSTLGPPALTRVFAPDAGDAVQLDVPVGASTLSAWIHPLPHDNPSYTVVEMREYDLPIPISDAPVKGLALIRDMLTLGVDLALAGGKSDPTKATIMSQVLDCRGRPVQGARFELLDGTTGLPVQTGSAPGLPHASYSRLALPSATCTFTTDKPATWLLVDAPVNVSGEVKTSRYRLRLVGRLRASDSQPAILGERELELFAGVVSVVTLHREAAH